MQMKLTQKRKEMYMANARILRLGPDTTFITLGALRWGNANFSVFRYQCKILPWVAEAMQGPNASVFASQWIIGLELIIEF